MQWIDRLPRHDFSVCDKFSAKILHKDKVNLIFGINTVIHGEVEAAFSESGIHYHLC